MSTQTHSSNYKAAKIIGFKYEQIRKIEVDENFEIRVDLLEAAIDKDLAAGKKPFCVVATAGTTNTAAVDPLRKISELCFDKDLWMHVDGAYGGAAILSDSYKHLLDGIEYADSITVDPHKWFFQPYEIGCVLVRNSRTLTKAFHVNPEYLKQVKGNVKEINFYDHGVQLTRRFRALKLYMSIKTFGLDSFKGAVQIGIDLAIDTQKYLEQRPNWEIISPAQLAVLNYRYNPSDLNLSEEELNTLNETLSKKMVDSCKAMLVTTTLNGKVVLRMCLINPRTTMKDIEETITLLEEMAPETLKASTSK